MEGCGPEPRRIPCDRRPQTVPWRGSARPLCVPSAVAASLEPPLCSVSRSTPGASCTLTVPHHPLTVPFEGVVAWPAPPFCSVSGARITAGTLFLFRLNVPNAQDRPPRCSATGSRPPPAGTRKLFRETRAPSPIGSVRFPWPFRGAPPVVPLYPLNVPSQPPNGSAERCFPPSNQKLGGALKL